MCYNWYEISIALYIVASNIFIHQIYFITKIEIFVASMLISV